MGTEHILYIVISLLVISLILFGAHFIKKQLYKDLFLLFWAVACLFFHISTMYTTLFDNGGIGNSYDNQLFPIYFCNYMMYLLLFASLWWNKKSKLFKCMSTFVAYGGTFGALITLFVTPPGFSSWMTLQAAFSHSCMLVGCLWLFVGGYVKISVYNLVPYSMGLLSCGVVGGLVELIFYLGGLPSPNAMYLVHGPNELPAFKWWMFVICMLALIFAFTSLWEYFTKPKEKRWYKTHEDLYLYFPKKKAKLALETQGISKIEGQQQVENQKNIKISSNNENVKNN